ncbi:MAG: nickel-dependent lactate racemase [candidate division WOR-3 bacterium]|jgi:nickel-dependent lactate racemase
MKVDLRYHHRSETVTIPDANLIGIIYPHRFSQPFADLDIALQNCLIQTRQFLGNASRIVLILNDYTRPTLNQLVLKKLEPELNHRQTRYLIALGTHRPATETELQTILGVEFFNRNRERLIQHNCQDTASLLFLGKTRFGTEVYLNRLLIWAEKIITINSIEPHYFAGYTGGRKSFIPGIAGARTIAQNHGLLLHPASAPCSLKDNPVHLDMNEAARMIPRPVFSIQLVQNHEHHLLAIHAGDLFTSFARACADAYRVFAVPVKQTADIILSILQPPYDINFYQSQRAVEFALPALKPGGIQITVSACTDGVGNDEFVKVLQSCSAPAQLLKMKPPETLGWHKAARLARIMQHHRLFTVMPGIKNELVTSVHMHPFTTVQAALDAAFTIAGRNASVIIIPDAGAVVPVT